MARKRTQVSASGYTILVIDDQEEILTSVGTLLEREGHQVLLASGVLQGLELFGRHRVHLILVDYFMPRMTGEDLITEIRKIDRDVQIVLLTGYAGEKPPREMLQRLDIQGYHDKTDGPDRLLLWVDVALKATEHVERIRESETIKSQMLANISHELRTPLHIILGYSEVLEGDLESFAPACEPLDGIRANAQSLLRLVNDFISLADVEHGVTSAESGDVRLGDLAGELTSHVTNLIRAKPIRFSWTTAPDLPSLAVDPAKLRVILANVLSNAVKFTKQGSIDLTADADDQVVRLVVRDTGIGITPEDHERIFESFRQLDGSSSRSYGGLGIGLSLARKLARMLGGDLSVESSLGNGAEFTLTVPRAERRASEPAAPDAAQP